MSTETETPTTTTTEISSLSHTTETVDTKMDDNKETTTTTEEKKDDGKEKEEKKEEKEKEEKKDDKKKEEKKEVEFKVEEDGDGDVDMHDAKEKVYLPFQLHEQMTELWKSQELTDVTFLVGPDAIPISAHRLVLAVASPVFRVMLYPTNQSITPTTPLKLSLPAISPSAFRTLISYLYSDHLEITADTITDLISLSSRYAIDKVRIACQRWMENDLTAENVCEMFQLATTLLGNDKFGLSFIEENTEDVLESDAFLQLDRAHIRTILLDEALTVDEFPLFQALIKWGKAELKRQRIHEDRDSIRSILSDLLPLIRFPNMALSEIAAHVTPSQLLEQDVLLSLFKYLSITPGADRDRLGALLPYSCKPREGGFVAKESKLLNRKFKKDILKLFQDKKVDLQLLYRGSRDGFDANTFHSKCDAKGATFTVIQSTKATGYAYIFGGYNAESWSQSGNYSSCDAWIYVLDNPDHKPMKFVISSQGNNVYNNSGYGPTWGGGHDLHVTSSMRSASNYSNPNSFMTAAPGYTGTFTNTTLAGGYNFTIEEIEVFAVKDKSKSKK